MDPIFLYLALILIVAFIISYITGLFKQPIVIGYILAGVVITLIINYGFASEPASASTIQMFSQLGIAFLLFMVGLHMNPKVIKEIGISSLVVGLTQMFLVFIISFLVCWKLVGLNTIVSSYVGIALMFSSTIIIMKLLSDERQLESLSGKISIGILIIQDVVAILILMFITSFFGGGESSNFGLFLLEQFFVGALLVFVLFLMGYFILPRFTQSIARSQELLFLFAIAWCFGIACLFNYFGFSLEIGALIAGVVLSISPYSVEMSSKIKPLRDFFLIIFFIILGLSLDTSGISGVIGYALIFSAIVLLIKPLTIMIPMKLFGYTKRNNFFTGISLAQISEFSLIILALGVSAGQISSEIFSAIILTGIFTIAISTYGMIYSSKLYDFFSKYLGIFEAKNVRKDKDLKKKFDVILFGYNRIGFNLLNALKKANKSYLVVDFNPEVISTLNKFRVPNVYGDAYDAELMGELPLEYAEMIISTIPDFETNELLIKTVKKYNKNAVVILRSNQISEALDLYVLGANYVLTPHFLGGEYLGNMIEDIGKNKKGYEQEKAKHITSLRDMINRGKEHGN
jgi:Kef-type K+ transport system membrane component KefB